MGIFTEIWITNTSYRQCITNIIRTQGTFMVGDMMYESVDFFLSLLKKKKM